MIFSHWKKNHFVGKFHSPFWHGRESSFPSNSFSNYENFHRRQHLVPTCIWFLPWWSLQYGVSSHHTRLIQIGLDGNSPWRLKTRWEKKQKGNQQSILLAELVDSIGRSVLGLTFFCIFINDMKMQHDMPVKQGKKSKKKPKKQPTNQKNLVMLIAKM